jgi:hypothetical protein
VEGLVTWLKQRTTTVWGNIEEMQNPVQHELTLASMMFIHASGPDCTNPRAIGGSATGGREAVSVVSNQYIYPQRERGKVIYYRSAIASIAAYDAGG